MRGCILLLALWSVGVLGIQESSSTSTMPAPTTTSSTPAPATTSSTPAPAINSSLSVATTPPPGNPSGPAADASKTLLEKVDKGVRDNSDWLVYVTMGIALFLIGVVTCIFTCSRQK